MNQKRNTILVIDDDPGLRKSLSAFLKKNGYEIISGENGEQGLQLLKNNEVDLVLLDIRMPGMDGITVLKEIKKLSPYLNVIIITGFATVETAVEAMKEGAVDYITKPFDLYELKDKIEKYIGQEYLVIKNRVEKEKDEQNRSRFNDTIGKSKEMQEIYQLIDKISSSDVTVLILGESGVGKEMVARSIYENSLRSKAPFVKLNCAAIPEHLLESELFGYEKGAFTGASQQKKGLFELANEGTIFLDEIGDMSLTTQSKILRILQEGEFQRVGGVKTLKANVRIIAATNIDIQEAINQGKFREDLYYRLNVVRITIPPLRKRIEDIPLLTQEFINSYNQKYGKQISRVTPEAMHLLMTYNWPGNVRELKNVCEQVVVLNETDVITADDLPEEIKRINLDTSYGDSSNQTLKDITRNLTIEIEKKIILDTLEETGWNRNETAEKLGITTRTLYNKIKEYELEK
jgi:two-component system response regulator AtoC